jgi:hypothetical protein
MKYFLIIMKKSFRAKALTLKVFNNHWLKPVVTRCFDGTDLLVASSQWMASICNRGLVDPITTGLSPWL